MMEISRYNNNNDIDDLNAYREYCDREDKFKLLALMVMPPPRGGFTKCIACGAPIEQPYFGGRTRRFCERPGCRKQGSRIMRRFRRWQWERRTRERLRAYWCELLPDSQHELEELLQSKWIMTQIEEGIYLHRNVEIADSVTRMIEAERRAAWRKMERWTVVLEQRAEKAEAQAEALQEELKALRQLLPGAMREDIERQPRYINIVEAQAANPRAVVPLAQHHLQQSDPLAQPRAPEQEPEDEDHSEVLATLRQAGLKSIEEARAAGEWDEE